MPVATGYIDLVVPGPPVTQNIATGFRPKCAFFLAAEYRGDGFHYTPTEVARMSFGMACIDTEKAAASIDIRPQAAYVLNDAHGYYQPSVFDWAGFNNVITNEFVVTSWNTSGLTLSVSAAETVRVYYLILGGNDLQAAAGQFTVDAGGSPTTVSGLAFEPQALWVIRGLEANLLATISAGMAATNGQWYNAMYTADNARRSYWAAADDAVIGDASDVSPWRAALDSFEPDGFVIDPVVAPPGDEVCSYVAFRDDHPDAGFAVGTDDWDNDTVAVSGLGFEPGAVLGMGGLHFAPGGFDNAFLASGVVAPGGDGGAVSTTVMYEGGGPGDPWAGPRSTYQETEGGSPLVMWAPGNSFGGSAPFIPPLYPEQEFARVNLDSFDSDGFTYTMTTSPFAGPPPGGYPDPTWPATPTVPWFWFAAAASPFRAVQQIYRRL